MRANVNNQYPDEPGGITLEAFLNLLDKVRKDSKGWRCKCPAHEGNSQTLKVSCGGDRIMVHCFAGCSYHEITASMGLRPRDLFYDALTDDRRREYQLNHIDKRIQTANNIIYFGDTAMQSGTITDDQRKEYSQAIVDKHLLIDERKAI